MCHFDMCVCLSLLSSFTFPTHTGVVRINREQVDFVVSKPPPQVDVDYYNYEESSFLSYTSRSKFGKGMAYLTLRNFVLAMMLLLRNIKGI